MTALPRAGSRPADPPPSRPADNRPPERRGTPGTRPVGPSGPAPGRDRQLRHAARALTVATATVVLTALPGLWPVTAAVGVLLLAARRDEPRGGHAGTRGESKPAAASWSYQRKETAAERQQGPRPWRGARYSDDEPQERAR